MKRADQRRLAMPRLMRHHPRAAMPADIVESPDLPVMAADDQRPLSDHVETLIIARFRNIVHMRRKESSVPPILAAADEEGLYRDRARFARQGEYVGIAEAFGMNGLASLNVGESAEPVAVDGSQLIILLLGGDGHRLSVRGKRRVGAKHERQGS